MGKHEKFLIGFSAENFWFSEKSFLQNIVFGNTSWFCIPLDLLAEFRIEIEYCWCFCLGDWLRRDNVKRWDQLSWRPHSVHFGIDEIPNESGSVKLRPMRWAPRQRLQSINLNYLQKDRFSLERFERGWKRRIKRKIKREKEREARAKKCANLFRRVKLVRGWYSPLAILNRPESNIKRQWAWICHIFSKSPSSRCWCVFPRIN